MPYCLVSFGSNLGDRQALLAAAAKQLSQHSQIHDFRTSRLFTTPPIGGPGGQSAFLNAVAAFRTDAPAREVLSWLQGIEQELGRQRKIRWDARSIDLDVVLYGDLMGGGSNLIVPHPRYTARMFVLEPACDVVPNWQDPRFGWTIERLTKHLRATPPSLALIGGEVAVRNRLCERVADRLEIPWVAAPPLADSPGLAGNVALDGVLYRTAPVAPVQWDVPADRPWIAACAPPLPKSSLSDHAADDFHLPRLLVRLQQTAAEHRWPAPHQIWPTGGAWPEYRLEIDDEQWAVEELVSAFDSLQCTVQPTTEGGHWY